MIQLRRAALLLVAVVAGWGGPGCHKGGADGGSFIVAFGIVTNVLPDGVVGTPYSLTLVSEGGTPPHTWSVLAGTFPPGLALNAGTGAITGTPTTRGVFAFVLRLVDAAGLTDVAGFTLTVTGGAPAALDITTLALPGGTLGTPYLLGVSVTGGTLPYSWTVSAGALPTGLSLAPGTGVISGTPVALGLFNFDVTVTDAAAGTDTQALSILINPPLNITTGSPLPDGSVGGPYNQLIAVAGGVAPYGWGVASGTLPPGLALNTGTGAVAGTPTLAGTFTFTIAAADTSGASDSQAYTLDINPAPAVNPIALADWTQNVAGYSQTVTGSAGTPPYTWAISAGALPAGLVLNAGTGAITGTPTAAGVANFTVELTDAAGAVAARALSIDVNPPPVVTTMLLPDWTIGSPYAQAVAATDGTPPYAWSVTAGALPGGLALNPATGAVSGTPTAVGTFNFTVRATDSVGGFDEQALSITINAAPSVTTVALPATTVGAAYNQSVAGANGTPPYAWSISLGALPAGLGIGAGTGAITGTPTTAGTANFTVRLLDAAGVAATRALSILVNPAPNVTTTMLPDATQGAAYNQTVLATGGTGGLTFTNPGGGLPNGLAIAAGGAITGTPLTVGTFNFTVRATDTLGVFDDQGLSIVVNGPLDITTLALPDWTINRPYNQTVVAGGGTGAHTFALTAGALPTGLALAANGALSGTPTVAATFMFDVTATDAALATDTQSYTVVINPAPTLMNPALPGWTINRPGYSQALAATGGTAPFTWGLVSGGVPAGMALSAGGVITGTPTALGTANFRVRATDAAGATAEQDLSITINDVPDITLPALPDWTRTVAYNQTVTATLGTTPYAFSLQAGALPTGLMIAAGGAITGTPTATGTFMFTIRVTDAAGATDDQAYTVVIADPPLITTSSVSDWTVNQAGYSQTVLSTGGTAPLSFALMPGPLPTGMSMSAAGVITGTPTATGTFMFTVRVTDAAGAFDDQALAITINDPPVVSTTMLPGWTINRPGYGQMLAVTDGTAAFSWALAPGSMPLPTGMTLSAGGLISMTPTATGVFSFTVRVTDLAGATDDQDLAITINDPPVIDLLALPNWTFMIPYSQTVTATLGTTPYTFSLQAGSLPSGLGLAANGAITGTPDSSGTSMFTVRVTDAAGATDDQAYTVVIADPPVITTAALPDWTVTRPYSQSVMASAGTPALTFALAPGSNPLPTGLALAANGALTGTPSAAATFGFTVRVTDAAGAFDDQAFTVVVNPVPVITTTSIPAWTLNHPGYSQTVVRTGGTAPFTFTMPLGMLPTGVSLNMSTGVISGTPQQAGTFNITVQVEDAAGATDTQDLTLVVNDELQISTSYPDGTQGVAYSQQLGRMGGTPAIGFALTGGSLPLGLSLAVDGTLSGTPTGSGPHSFTITATDSAGAIDTELVALSLVANPPLISTANLPKATPGVYYHVQLRNTGGVAPFAWSEVGAGLTGSGLTLNADGTITGTPAGLPGMLAFTARVTDSATPAPNLSDAALTIEIVALELADTALALTVRRIPDATEGSFYGEPLSVTGGFGPLYSFTVDPEGTPLPVGMFLDPSGAVLGIPAPGTAGIYHVTIVIAETFGMPPPTGKAHLTLVVRPPAEPPLTITTGALAGGSVRVEYAPVVLNAVFGETPYRWSLTEGTELPDGMFLSPEGVLYGIPRFKGVFDLRVRVRDSGLPARTAVATLTLTVVDASAFRVDQASMPDGTFGAPYSAFLTATGGPVAFWIGNFEQLEAMGLEVDSATGEVRDTGMGITATGSARFVAVAVGTGPAPRPTAFASITITVPPPAFGITTTSLPSPQPGVPYSATPTLAGGTGPFSWVELSGDLMGTGLVLDPVTGEISGTPTFGGDDMRLVLEVTDSTMATTRAMVRLTIQDGEPGFSSMGPLTTPFRVAAPGIVGGGTYVDNMFLNGSDPDLIRTELRPLELLPGGATLDPARRRVSSPGLTVPGRRVAQFRTLGKEDGDGGILPVTTGEVSVLYRVIEVSGAFRISNPMLPSAAEGAAYVQTLRIEAPPAMTAYSWAIEDGFLPPGIALDPVNGLLEGTPFVAGEYAFTVAVTQGASTARRHYRLPVSPAMGFQVATRRLPDGTPGLPYAALLTHLNMPAPVTWSDAGSPTTFAMLGLTLDPSGAVTGIPTAAAGRYLVGATATNGIESHAALIEIELRPLQIAAGGIVNFGFLGETYAESIVAVGGTGPYSYAVQPGTFLPPGIVLAADGTLSGTPTATTGFFDLFVEVTDSLGRTGFARLNTIMLPTGSGALEFLPEFGDGLSDLSAGVAMTPETRGAQGGTPAYAFAVSPTLLPAPFNPHRGLPPAVGMMTVGPLPNFAEFSGTPLVTGEFFELIQVTDTAMGASDLLMMARVNPPPVGPGVFSRQIPDGSASDPDYPLTTISYSQPGPGPYTYAIAAGAPAGLVIDAGTGQVSSPTSLAAGVYYVLISITDTSGPTTGFGRVKLVVRP